MVTLSKKHGNESYNPEMWNTGLSGENPIFSLMLKSRNGNYCHALEVENVQEIESAIEALYEELGEKFTKQDYIKFFKTLDIIALDDECENEVYSFDVESFINNLIIE